MTDYKKIEEELEKERKSSITIGGYGGIKIPLDEEIKRGISDFVYRKIKDILENDEELMKKISMIIIRWKDYFIREFKPIVKEMIEDLDFNIDFRET